MNLAVPLATATCHVGTVMSFALVALFTAQIHGVPLGVESLAIALVAAVLAGIATAGMPGPITHHMLLIVLAPLGLPVEVGLITMMAIAPIIEPIVIAADVHGNCAVACLVARRPEESKPGTAAG